MKQPDDIATAVRLLWAGVFPESTVPTNPSTSLHSFNLPDLKPGWLFTGPGPLNVPNKNFGLTKDIARYSHEYLWDYSGWSGEMTTGFYAVKADSVHAKENMRQVMLFNKMPSSAELIATAELETAKWKKKYADLQMKVRKFADNEL